MNIFRHVENEYFKRARAVKATVIVKRYAIVIHKLSEEKKNDISGYYEYGYRLCKYRTVFYTKALCRK